MAGKQIERASNSCFLIGKQLLELGELTRPTRIGGFFRFGIAVNNLVDSFAS